MCFFKFCIFAENTIKIGVSAKKQEKKHKKNLVLKTGQASVKNWSKYVAMLRNKIGPVFNARHVVFFCCFLLFFEKNPLLSAGKMRFPKTKKNKKNKKMDQFLTLEKAKIGPAFNSTTYIYIYAVKLLTGPSLGVSKVINWAKSKLLTGPRSFLHYKNRGFRRFFLFNYHCVSFLVPNNF